MKLHVGKRYLVTFRLTNICEVFVLEITTEHVKFRNENKTKSWHRIDDIKIIEELPNEEDKKYDWDVF